MVVNITAEDPQPTIHSHINGTTEEILDRLCVTELLKGWPVYRDASEWAHYRNCFAEQAYIFTSKSIIFRLFVSFTLLNLPSKTSH